MNNNKIIIGHNSKKKIVTDEKIKEIAKNLIVESFKSWRKNKEKKGITTEHFVLNLIAPKERLISAVIQSLQTSLGTKFWQNLVNQLAKENSFTICNVKEFYKPDTQKLNKLIDSWKSKRENFSEMITLVKFKKELIRKIKKNKKKFKKVKKVKATKGDGLDIWLKKNNVNYLFEIKSPHVNAGNGKDFSLKLMKMYHHHLFWSPDSKVFAKMAFPYNPFNVNYEIAQKGRLAPLLKNKDYLVGKDFWKFITGNVNCMDMLAESIKEANTESNLSDDIDYFIKKYE